MLIPETGVHQTSERYFFTPSSLARELFYYPTRCGHYFCNHRYAFSHRSEIALQGDHNQNIMLFWVQAGAMELTLGGVPTLAAAGQAVLFDCREPYQYAGSDGLEFMWLLFNGLNVRAFYRRIVQAHGGRPVFTPPGGAEIASRTRPPSTEMTEMEISEPIITDSPGLRCRISMSPPPPRGQSPPGDAAYHRLPSP